MTTTEIILLAIIILENINFYCIKNKKVKIQPKGFQKIIMEYRLDVTQMREDIEKIKSSIPTVSVKDIEKCIKDNAFAITSLE